jgi:hypothetical protein
MAFEHLQSELGLLMTRMQNEPEDRHELYLVIRQKLNEIKAFGMPLPDDLVQFERRLENRIRARSREPAPRDCQIALNSKVGGPNAVAVHGVVLVDHPGRDLRSGWLVDCRAEGNAWCLPGDQQAIHSSDLVAVSLASVVRFVANKCLPRGVEAQVGGAEHGIEPRFIHTA